MQATRVFVNKDDMRAFSRSMRADGKTVAFVPTMGYLHDGHLSLVTIAKSFADIVVVSIYVNPTQFSVNEDFSVYPRSDEEDMTKLRAHGVDAVFKPATSLYVAGTDDSMVVGTTTTSAPPPTIAPHETYITVEHLQQGMCGASRPHFFRGVATVVCKLFHIVEPDVAVFGKKDFQQLRVIQRMVRDLDMAIRVVGGEISREPDGLAMSSRNALLTPVHRAQAPVIREALLWASSHIASASGACLVSDIVQGVSQRIEQGGGVMDYVEVRELDNLVPVQDAAKQPVLIAIAAKFGSVRLIDNIEVGV